MTVACIANTIHFYGLANHLNEQRKKNEFCDVLLKVAGSTLPGHACILSAVSPFFRSLIHGQPPSTPQEINLTVPDMEGKGEQEEEGGRLEVVACLLDYIYTGQITLKQGTVDLVLKMAEAFMLDGLLGLVRRYLNSRQEAKSVTEPVQQCSAVPAKRVVTLPVRRRIGEESFLMLVKPNVAVATQHRDLIPKRKVTLPLRRQVGATSFNTTAKANYAAPVQRSCLTPTGRVATLPVRRQIGTPHIRAGGISDVSRLSLRTGTVAKRATTTVKKYWFSCSQCRFFSSDLRAVRDHKLIHPGSTYVCISCGFFTGQCGRLLEHLLTADHEETRCSLCPFETDDPTAFREHLKTDHDPGKPHYCRQCDFKCRSRSHLNAHEKKHGSARPFVCDICAAAFKWKKALQTHKICHTKEKPFICDKCDFRTAYKKTLNIHLRRHRGEMIPCPREKCKCVCYDQRQLDKHMLTHTNKKHYICEACGEKFAQEHSLKRHLKIHDREAYNLNCNNCSYVTTRNDKLREHMRKSHNLQLALVRNLHRPSTLPEATLKPSSSVALPCDRLEDTGDKCVAESTTSYQDPGRDQQQINFDRRIEDQHHDSCRFNRHKDFDELDQQRPPPSTSQSLRLQANTSEMMFVATNLSLGLMDFSRH